MPRTASVTLVIGDDQRVLVELDLDALEALLHVREREHVVDGTVAHLRAVDEEHRVAHLAREFEVVRRDDHRDAAGLERTQGVDEGVAIRLVQPVERLVEQEQARLRRERAREEPALALAAPAALAQSDGPALFVGNNGNLEGSVTAFRINADGTLQFANRLITGVRATTSDPCAGCNAYEISLSPDGRHIVSAHASGSLDGLTFFRVNADATLTQLLQLALPTGQGTPLDATWIDNERIAVTRTDTSPDRIVVYRFNPTVPSITGHPCALRTQIALCCIRPLWMPT